MIIQNDMLRKQLTESKKTLNSISKSHTTIKGHVDEVCELFYDLDELSDEIMRTDLHKEWMDDEVEKKYLMDVLQYLSSRIVFSPEL
jgi:hypothetical protein